MPFIPHISRYRSTKHAGASQRRIQKGKQILSDLLNPRPRLGDDYKRSPELDPWDAHKM